MILTKLLNALLIFQESTRYNYIILSDQKEPTDVHIVGLNLQPIRFMSGMAGLVFSK
jgi:hypothetical protein